MWRVKKLERDVLLGGSASDARVTPGRSTSIHQPAGTKVGPEASISPGPTYDEISEEIILED